MSHPLWWITTPELYSHSRVGVVGLWALPTREDSPRKSSPSLGDLRLRKSGCLSIPHLPSPSRPAPAVPSFARRWRLFSAASLMSASLLAGIIFYFKAVSEEVQRVKKMTLRIPVGIRHVMVVLCHHGYRTGNECLLSIIASFGG